MRLGMAVVPKLPLAGYPAVVAMLMVAAAGFAGIGWLKEGETRPAANVLGSMRLFDDDGGAGMFSSTVMAPGVGVSRCIRIGYDGTSGGASVMLAAESVSGTLVDSLDVIVDRGQPGAGTDCAGFSGTRVFSGGLRELAAGPRDDGLGVATGWRPGDGDSQTFRVTIVLTGLKQPDAGASAQADFVWRLQPDATPAPSTGAATPSPTTSALPAPAATPSSGGLGEPHSAEAKGRDGPSSIVRQVLRTIALVAKQVGRHAAIPIGLIVVMIVFLLVQNSADRRDPKLALAPVSRSRYVWIPRTPRGDG